MKTNLKSTKNPIMNNDTDLDGAKIPLDNESTKATDRQRPTSWMGGSSDVKRIHDNFFDSNSQTSTNQQMSEISKTSKPASDINVIQSVKKSGNLKPATYKGMKLGRCKIIPPNETEKFVLAKSN